ncbi:MAG: SAM-dependent chlorinase/fluorinase [Candidatus Sumerlaeaceae bacterium]|nr:SAM-dependent chlorinase/fluorinase [Candidatus Sumerlaeaceae bacterium]
MRKTSSALPSNDMSHRPTIALLTDFGWDGWYVGAMKGVILSICPHANVVDLTHGVAPHSIAEGALLLNAMQQYFPKGTIFVAVVDPGVGTVREPILAQADGKFFVAPNNGLLGLVLQRATDWECRLISNEKYFLPNVSSTFHGRDIFAPVAAHLACGVPVKEIAPKKTECFRLATAAASYDRGYLEGNIIYFDRFGNAVTNITQELFEKGFGKKQSARKSRRIQETEAVVSVVVGNYELPKICKTFADVKPGEPVAYWGSLGTLEIGINLGNAHQAMGLRLLDKVTIKKVGNYAA